MNTTQALRPLTESQIEHYYREGYLVAPQLVPHAEIDQALAAAGPALKDIKPGGDWTPVIFKHDQPAQDAGIHRLLIEPHIVAAVEQLFEMPAYPFYGMLAVVPAQGGKGLPWHQDNQYTQYFGHALNSFVALCDITPDKAILWVAPGSHHLGTQPAKPSTDYGGAHREAVVEPANGQPLPGMKKGDVCLFNRLTYHRSLRNETNEHRYAYAAQYLSASARLATTGKKDPRRMAVGDLQEIFHRAGVA
jgi:hypothetical protein